MRVEDMAMERGLRSTTVVGTLLLFVLFLGVTLSSSATGATQPRLSASLENNDGRAGACYSFYPDEFAGTGRPYMPLAYAAGSRWDRFDFVWPNLQRPDGSWKTDGIDAYDTLVNDLCDADLDIVGILLWTPDWAASSGVRGHLVPQMGERPPGWYSRVGTDRPESPSNPAVAAAASAPPRGLYQEWHDWTESDGDPINYWGRFVYQIVTRYGDRVRHWEMWNEPEWSYFWTGTSSDYAQLLKVGYQATKAACPNCQVLFGGLHYWANPDYYKWVLNTLRDDPEAAESDYFFDVMSVHLYSRSSNAFDVVNDIRSGMKARISDHPIWLTETGVPVWDDARANPATVKYDYAATQQEAAAYVIQSYANAWAADVSRYFFFRTHDADMSEYFGLMRNDRSPRPAYDAFQVATTYLISPTLVTRQAEDQGVRRVTLWGTPRGKVSVLWNETPVPVDFRYGATLSTAVCVDQEGGAQVLHAAEGAYDVRLPGATANLVTNPDDYFIGGEPYLIIEEDTVPPSDAAVQPLPTTTYSHTIPISWSASDVQAGIWGVEVQVREGQSGAWVDWLGLAETQGVWLADYDTGEHDTLYCFRVRAWDHAGNLGPWSEAQRCTRLDMDREVHVSVETVFGDENGNGDWDVEGDEVALDTLSFRLVDSSGSDVVTPQCSASWELTATLRANDYIFVFEPSNWPSPPPGWLPWRKQINLKPGATTWELIDQVIGLPRHRSSSYLPFAADDG